jgi:hypothetical protein
MISIRLVATVWAHVKNPIRQGTPEKYCPLIRKLNDSNSIEIKYFDEIRKRSISPDLFQINFCRLILGP